MLKTQTQELRPLQPEDMKDLTGTEKIHLKFDLTIQRPLKMPYPVQKNIAGVIYKDYEKEVQQQLTSFALEWKRWPIPESYIIKAMDDAKLNIIKKFRELGLSR